MKKTINLFWLFLYLTTVRAQTFESPVIIEPTYPMVGDTIRVGLFHTFYPPCLTLPANNFQGLSHLFEYNGSDIRLTAVDDSNIIPICNPFPISPAPRIYYDLGELPKGTYSLETWIIDNTTPLPVPSSGYFPLVYGPTLTFDVTAPISVDSLSIGWKLLYVFLLLLITYLIKRQFFLYTK